MQRFLIKTDLKLIKYVIYLCSNLENKGKNICFSASFKASPCGLELTLFFEISWMENQQFRFHPHFLVWWWRFWWVIRSIDRGQLLQFHCKCVFVCVTRASSAALVGGIITLLSCFFILHWIIHSIKTFAYTVFLFIFAFAAKCAKAVSCCTFSLSILFFCLLLPKQH